jgi:uncharacterized protein (DUF362 family)
VAEKRERLSQTGLSRREFLLAMTTAAAAAGLGSLYWPHLRRLWRARKLWSETFVAHLPGYEADLAGAIRAGFRELGISPDEIRGKRILLKPNLVETQAGAIHINTHPLVVQAAMEAFLAYGAARVIVAEGPGHERDTLLILEETGLIGVLSEHRAGFVDLNTDRPYGLVNAGRRSRLKKLYFPETLRTADWIVSMPKMKTHHWAGVTLSMKNLFGVMPGALYGWPKNILHWAGIHETIMDIYATLQPHLAIVDGIIGMEGDGPIMGDPKAAGVLVMGRNFPAVDATCARIMGINPKKVKYLARANGWLGTIYESNIRQRGEAISSVRTEFALLDRIPAHKGIRLR